MTIDLFDLECVRLMLKRLVEYIRASANLYTEVRKIRSGPLKGRDKLVTPKRELKQLRDMLREQESDLEMLATEVNLTPEEENDLKFAADYRQASIHAYFGKYFVFAEMKE